MICQNAAAGYEIELGIGKKVGVHGMHGNAVINHTFVCLDGWYFNSPEAPFLALYLLCSFTKLLLKLHLGTWFGYFCFIFRQTYNGYIPVIWLNRVEGVSYLHDAPFFDDTPISPKILF